MEEKKYISKLSLYETQKAIKFSKDTFERKIAKKLNLDRVTAPLILERKSKINDDLGIFHSSLSFIPNNLRKEVEIVQSLAKWKRMALHKYGYQKYEGIYADMNAIRPLDKIDSIHSLYVDQWDWELVIDDKDRSLMFLKRVVRQIVAALAQTKQQLKKKFPVLKDKISSKVYFISSKHLEELYPELMPSQRESKVCQKYKTVFIYSIGYNLKNGKPHSLRAADYDDFELNGDLVLWSNVLDMAVEISSMGIRVDKDSLMKQILFLNRKDLLVSDYHKMILDDTLPKTIGGGIGQSRICMLLLEKSHIAEVQVSVWDDNTIQYLKDNNIDCL